MIDIKTDLVSLLIIYIEEESEEEKRFIEDQRNCELKVCITVSHSNCGWNNNESDLLMIHTRLNQSNEFIEENIDQIPNEFYIKSQVVSHCAGMLSSANKIMSIDTIVTKHNYNCETVYKTFLTRSSDDKRKKTQRSFTREISLYCDPKTKLGNRFSVVISDDDCNITKPSVPNPPSKLKVKKRRSFKLSFVNKKSKSIEEQIVLQPIKKQKSNFFKGFKNLFHKSRTVSIEDKPVPISPTIRGTENTKPSLIPEVKTFSTEQTEMEKQKPTNILAKICLKNGTKKFEIIDDNIPFIDDIEDEEVEEGERSECVGNSNSDSDCGSFVHFDFTDSSDIRDTINRIIKGMSCDCIKEKITLMSNLLRYLSIKDQKSIDEIRPRTKKFDHAKQHFIDCAVWICEKKNAIYQIKRFQSTENIQDLCQICLDIDVHFNESLCTVFVPFLKEIEMKEKKELCLCERRKKEKIKAYIYSAMKSMKINGEFKRSFNMVTNHFTDCICDWMPPSVNNNYDDANETSSCNCHKRRMLILAQFMCHIFFKKCLMTDDTNEFGLTTKHSTSCPRHLSTSIISPLSFTLSPFSDGSPVFDSFNPIVTPTTSNFNTPEVLRKRAKTNSCSSTHSIKTLNNMIQIIKLGYEIECTIETIEFFIKCQDFNSFEKGIVEALDLNVSIEHMCLFFYLIRKIVRHIDDPSCVDNEDIKRIIEYAETFLVKHYLDEINKQGGLEKFVLGIDSLD